MKPAAVQGHLDGMLLAILSGAPMHGYAIIEELRRRSRGSFDLPEGSVYPALYRLEEDGLVTSAWVVVEGRRRRVYSLTRRGRAALGRQREGWRSFARAVDAVYGGAR
jgi:DNA-binding PadR family transcriptional regulator